MINILYVAPLIPAASGSGGKKAIYNHVQELESLKKDFFIQYIFVNVEDELVDMSWLNAASMHILERAIGKITGGLSAKLKGFWQLIADGRPRCAAVVAPTDGVSLISEIIFESHAQLVIIDHLNSYGLISKINHNLPILYIAHNCEYKIAHQQLRTVTKLMQKIGLYFDLIKLKNFEKKLLQCSSNILLIGSGDLKSNIIGQYANKVRVWPELPDCKKVRWSYKGSKKIIFVGSPKYFPNKDAIDWLVYQLMPEIKVINSEISLHLVGADADLWRDSCLERIFFEGFVSDEKLGELHQGADVFICPVVLGAGIKIKVLEAASYGVPIVATSESLEGIDFLQDVAVCISRNAVNAAEKLVELIYSKESLQDISDRQILKLKEAKKSRVGIKEVIEELSGRNE